MGNLLPCSTALRTPFEPRKRDLKAGDRYVSRKVVFLETRYLMVLNVMVRIPLLLTTPHPHSCPQYVGDIIICPKNEDYTRGFLGYHTMGNLGDFNGWAGRSFN